MKFNEQYCSFTHGGGESRHFDLEVFVNCLQQDISTWRSFVNFDKDLRVETSPMCKAAVLLIIFHVYTYSCLDAWSNLRAYTVILVSPDPTSLLPKAC